MRDQGLDEAIRAAGGVSELARRIGISQPSVSNWARIPAERVLAVEAATGVDRAVLRPDLYGEADAGSDIDEIDVARAQEYALLAALLARAPDAALAEAARRRCAAMPSPLGVAHVALARSREPRRTPNASSASSSISSSALGRGELLPYGSYYLTGFLHERPLARLRDDLAQLGIERAEGNAEPEDHAAILCEIMAGLDRRPLRGAGRRRPRDCSRSISRPGSGASSPISSAPRRRTSTAASARSAACSSKSKPRLSRCRRDAARAERRDGGDGDDNRTKSGGWPP